MGLDMYLTKKTYVQNWGHTKPEEKIEITIKKGFKTVTPDYIDVTKVKYIEEEAGYWRKANAIHRWFVDNVQKGQDDCKDYYVGEGDMQNLLDLVNKVLENHSLAEELLPAQEGFFFGGTEYDDYYFEDLKYTKEVLEKALNGTGS